MKTWSAVYSSKIAAQLPMHCQQIARNQRSYKIISSSKWIESFRYNNKIKIFSNILFINFLLRWSALYIALHDNLYKRNSFSCPNLRMQSLKLSSRPCQIFNMGSNSKVGQCAPGSTLWFMTYNLISQGFSMGYSLSKYWTYFRQIYYNEWQIRQTKIQ